MMNLQLCWFVWKPTLLLGEGRRGGVGEEEGKGGKESWCSGITAVVGNPGTHDKMDGGIYPLQYLTRGDDLCNHPPSCEKLTIFWLIFTNIQSKSTDFYLKKADFWGGHIHPQTPPSVRKHNWRWCTTKSSPHVKAGYATDFISNRLAIPPVLELSTEDSTCCCKYLLHVIDCSCFACSLKYSCWQWPNSYRLKNGWMGRHR